MIWGRIGEMLPGSGAQPRPHGTSTSGCQHLPSCLKPQRGFKGDVLLRWKNTKGKEFVFLKSFITQTAAQDLKLARNNGSKQRIGLGQLEMARAPRRPPQRAQLYTERKQCEGTGLVWGFSTLLFLFLNTFVVQ